MSTASFLPINQLLFKRDQAAWEDYWGSADDSQHPILQDYPSYIAMLVEKIHRAKVKRIFLIHKDKAFFLAGMLAAFQAGIPVVLPQSEAPSLLQELLQPEDGVLSNHRSLSALTPAFIFMPDKGDLGKRPLTPCAFDASKTVIIFYTSGSTDTPKPIVKTVSQLQAEICLIDKMWGISSGTAYVFSTVSHHHIYGLIFSLLWPVCAGYKIKSQIISYWEELDNKMQVSNYLISSPSHLGRIPASILFNPGIFKSIFSSGGPLSFEAAHQVETCFGILPTEVFGSTETGGIAYRQQAHPEQLWTTFEGIEILEGDDQKLSLKSPYLPHQQFYPTQDRVLIHDSSHFHLIGRADRVIKIEGKRVSLIEMEKRLDDCEWVQESIMIPLKTARREEIGAIVVLSAMGQQKLVSIGKVSFCQELRRKISPYFDTVILPRKWRFVDMIPLNSQGKRPYLLLKNLFNQEGQK